MLQEKMPQGVKINAETLIKDGGFSGGQPYFHCFVAQITDPVQSNDPNLVVIGPNPSTAIVGFVLYVYIYSTWEGKSIWMEDLYVKPNYRGHGIGSKLWKQVAIEAINNDCKRIDFYVLNWNKSSIDFYHSQGAIDLTMKEGWHYFRLNRDKIESLAG